ncbi:molybdenum cofactor sulfurase-like [Senna tora]|uniref:Molybdenum cofactor sulfurase-like n=1 Tax=Senna tora TaxID=362788 RepID=A0A834W966_9FABA|nr:molybdenum cofactor sulfurase-like [Senna tora]
MPSPCGPSSEPSPPCFNGCFPSSSFLASSESTTSNSTKTRSNTAYDFLKATSSTLHPNAEFTNHESLPSLQDSYSDFTKAYPLFSNTLKADQIRAQEYYHLNNNFCNLCFDYSGFGLFSYAQLHRERSCLHIASSSSSSHPPPPPPLETPFFEISYSSVNLYSQIAYGGEEPSEIESKIREKIMRFMSFSADEYALVFTANQISAFKILADSFQFSPNGGNLLTVYDHHNESLHEMIKICKNQGTRVASAEFSWPGLQIQGKKLSKTIRKKRGLFVFPVHSRVTGSPYSYMWMSLAQENGWRVLLDACALAPKEMDTLGLSFFKPDYLICSFYKVFGDNPSGFGCLFVKKSSVSALKDSRNNTGIVRLVPSSSSEPEICDGSKTSKCKTLECKGLENAEEVGLVGISSRGRYLVNWVVHALTRLEHPHREINKGVSLIRIYGPKVNSHRGCAIAFNVFDWKGEKIDPVIVQKLADRNNVSLSSKLNFLNNFEDVYKLWSFVSRFLDADFVEKERWRYMALNQETLEL